MKRRVFFVFVIFVLVMGLAIANNAAKNNKTDKNTIDEINKKGKVKVIVSLNDEYEDKGLFKSKVKETNASEVKKKVRNVKREFSSFNGFSAEVNKEELEKLEEDKRVKKIEYDAPVQAFLQDSVGLINATLGGTIKVNGINVTGENETICIVDTGINYTHVDFGSCSNDSFLAGNCGKVLAGYDYSNNDADPYDDHGHGTHIAGIAAANGSVMGVAPNAKLVVIKSLNGAGAGSTSDIVAGIDWCVGNASVYNISVISLSLGTDCDLTPNLCYNSSCDSSQTSFSSSINNATARNISVVIATGNDFHTVNISSPACIQNATRVAATDKSDGFASYSNRGAGFEIILAPGSSINSSSKSGSYETRSGTSMAAPHVAGAVALLNQFKKLEKNEILTPQQLKVKLNNTGKIINDASTGLNFSRIDIYNAILGLDESLPNVTLRTANNTKTLNKNLTFSCNATDLQLKNVTLRLWNSTAVYNESSMNVRGTFNETSFNLTNINFDSYNWNCFFCDAKGNCSYALANFSLSVVDLVTTLVLPSDNFITKTNQNFTCNATSNYFLTNTTFYLWNSSSFIYNETKNITGLSNQTNFTYNFSLDDSYKWNCLFSNNQSLLAFSSSNFTFVYDSIAPNMNLNLVNNSWYNAARFNISLNENGSCVFSLNNSENVSLTRQNNTYFNYTNTTFQEGQHNVTFYCNDTAGKLNFSSLIFNVDKTSPNITLVLPNNSYSETASSTSINFQFNVADNLNMSSCKLVLLPANSTTLNSSAINYTSTITISKSVSSGNYNWNINCTDQAGNEGNSSFRNFTIIEPVVTTTSTGESSGGGGSSTIESLLVYTLTNEQIFSGFSRELKVNDKIKFSLKNEMHAITLVSLTLTSATINVSSKSQIALLTINEEKKFELTNDSIYDLSVKLSYILNNKASFTIKIINESIVINKTIMQTVKEVNATNETKQVNESVDNPIQPEEEKSYISYIIVLLLIIVVAVIYVLIRKSKKREIEKEESNENSGMKRKNKNA